MSDDKAGGRRGRRIPEWRRRDYELRIRLDRLERAFLAQECGTNGLTLSEFVRTLIHKELASRPDVPAGDLVEEVDDEGYSTGEMVRAMVSQREALRRRVSRMSVEELDAWVDEQLDFSDYEGASE